MAAAQGPYSGVAPDDWKDWRWQEKNSLRSASDVRKVFPNFPDEELERIAEYEKRYRWNITPYTVSLMGLDASGNPSGSDPLAMQTFPIRGFRLDTAADSYGGDGQPNWELAGEMATPVLQHKYTKKAVIRLTNTCLSYCGFCYEVERVEDREAAKKALTGPLWQRSLDYIREHREISEVILSGGDPLLLDNESLGAKLADIRGIPTVRAIRIHTRALTFNPFRIDEGLIGALRESRVTELGLHLSHPNELAAEAKRALERFDSLRYGNILKMGQTILLKGINDDPAVLEELFMRMYSEFLIKPYYLFHAMPGEQGAEQYRTSVKKGVTLMKALKRHISNVAMPEYVIAHHNGKQAVPLEESGTPEFVYESHGGRPTIRFMNWRGNWETYPDGKD